MVSLKNINIEYTLSAGFGAAGLVLSLLTGLFSGNEIPVIFLKAFITAIIFVILGYICLFIIKKFVPEIYQIICLINSNEELNIDVEASDDKIDQKSEININQNKNFGDTDISGSPGFDRGVSVKSEDTELESEFNSVGNNGDNYSSLKTNEKDSVEISHNAFKESNIKYEPKIAAQAIRTMMKRDE